MRPLSSRSTNVTFGFGLCSACKPAPQSVGTRSLQCIHVGRCGCLCTDISSSETTHFFCTVTFLVMTDAMISISRRITIRHRYIGTLAPNFPAFICRLSVNIPASIDSRVYYTSILPKIEDCGVISCFCCLLHPLPCSLSRVLI